METKRSHMFPLISLSECPDLAAVLVQRGQVEFGLQGSDKDQIPGRDRRSVYLAADFLRPEHLAVAVQGKQGTRLCRNKNIFITEERTCSNGPIWLHRCPVQSACCCVE